MNWLMRLLFCICLIFFGYKAIAAEFGGDYQGIFAFYDAIPFILLIVATIAIFAIDFTQYREYSRWYQFASTFIGAVMCLIVVGRIIYKNSIANDETLFTVRNQAGAQYVMEFEFKEKNNFRVRETDMFGNTTYYGKYSRNSNRITILRSNYHGESFPKTGVIKDSLVYWEGFETMELRQPEN
jgi:hypothetical protein